MIRLALLAVLFLSSAPASAGEADVVAVEVRRTGPGEYAFDVTVRHADEGFDHYADRFEIVGPGGAVLGTRTLLHPHVTEQPFTRSLTGVAISESISEVVVRAHDSVHGLGGRETTVALPR